jgi:hypothetical protein
MKGIHSVYALITFMYITTSNSKWVSPLVIIPKNDENWRFCVDYRDLNKVIAKDYFPLPFIDQFLNTLAGNKYLCLCFGFNITKFS